MPKVIELYGGALADFDPDNTLAQTNNMAQEIETAFNAARASVGITQPLPSGPQAQDMRLLFLAIAHGVIQHLVKNPEAFQVTVTSGQVVSQGGVTTINGT
jgi:hypothetical protein